MIWEDIAQSLGRGEEWISMRTYKQFCQKVEAKDDLSIDVLELFGMVVTAWECNVLGANTAQRSRGNVSMR